MLSESEYQALGINLSIIAGEESEEQEEPDDMIRRINQLVELEETRNQVNQRLMEYQEKMKYLFDHHAKDRNLQVGDLVLKKENMVNSTPSGLVRSKLWNMGAIILSGWRIYRVTCWMLL